MLACHTCELTMAAGASSIRHAHAHCPRCGEVLHRRKPHSIERTRLDRITESVGRWSMVEIYVVAILVTMIQLGNLATIEAGPGAVFFAAIVVLTMFGAMAFDPRLIWDNLEHDYDGAS